MVESRGGDTTQDEGWRPIPLCRSLLTGGDTHLADGRERGGALAQAEAVAALGGPVRQHGAGIAAAPARVAAAVTAARLIRRHLQRISTLSATYRGCHAYHVAKYLQSPAKDAHAASTIGLQRRYGNAMATRPALRVVQRTIRCTF